MQLRIAKMRGIAPRGIAPVDLSKTDGEPDRAALLAMFAGEVGEPLGAFTHAYLPEAALRQMLVVALYMRHHATHQRRHAGLCQKIGKKVGYTAMHVSRIIKQYNQPDVPQTPR